MIRAPDKALPHLHVADAPDIGLDEPEHDQERAVREHRHRGFAEGVVLPVVVTAGGVALGPDFGLPDQFVRFYAEIIVRGPRDGEAYPWVAVLPLVVCHQRPSVLQGGQ